MRSARPTVIRLLLVAALVLPQAARGTWSITAVDPRTRQVGIALASCIGGVEISEAGGVLPGVGVVAAQANSNPAGRDLALDLLASGAPPARVVEAISAETFDPQPLLSWITGRQSRQYGVVALAFAEEPATFTGSRVMGWAGSLHARGVSVQGNILRGVEVAEAALATYEEAAACSLPERLMLALEAGAAAGGDRRCEAGLAALSAYLEVAWPEDRPGESSLRIAVNHPRDTTRVSRYFRQLLLPERGVAEDDPLRSLRERFGWWRAETGRSSDEPGCG